MTQAIKHLFRDEEHASNIIVGAASAAMAVGLIVAALAMALMK